MDNTFYQEKAATVCGLRDHARVLASIKKISRSKGQL